MVTYQVLKTSSSIVDGWTPCCFRTKCREPYVLPISMLDGWGKVGTMAGR